MISAIILAAGKSERMELGNKLLLETKNSTIIQTTIRKIKASKVNEIVLVLGKNAQMFKDKINDKNIIFVVNKNFQDGIASSIKKGLENIDKNTKGAMICLGDMPLIKTSTYNKIVNSFNENGNKSVIPFFNKIKGNPVLFNKAYFKKLMQIKGDKGAKLLLKKYSENFFQLSVSDQSILQDIDYAKEYYDFLKND